MSSDFRMVRPFEQVFSSFRIFLHSMPKGWALPVSLWFGFYSCELKAEESSRTSSVSAVAYAALIEHPTVGAGRSILGPGEIELREMFWSAVESAVMKSPQLRRSLAEVEVAQADVDEAKGRRWPQLNIGAQSQSAKFGTGRYNEVASTAGVNFNVSTTLYDWGRIRNTIASHEHVKRAAAAGSDAEVESTAFEVSATMIELGKQRIIIDVAHEFERRMDELAKMLADIVAVDKGRLSELTQARARLLQARSARENAEMQAENAEIQLRRLIGDKPVMIPRAREWNLQIADQDRLLAQIPVHPSVMRAEYSVDAAQLQARAVRSSVLPQLNWVISKTTAEDGLGREQPLQTSLAVTWAAFDGGSARAAERAALQRAQVGRHESEQQRLDIEFGVRTASHNAKTLLERAELYRDLSIETDRVRQAFYEQWYHLGRRTLLDVLSAESDHFGNQVSEVTSRFEGYQAIFRQYAGAGSLVKWLRGKPEQAVDY